MSDPSATPSAFEVSVVLTPHHTAGIERDECVEHLLLLGVQGLGGEGCRRLHRHEPEGLEQVGDHHVAECSGGVVELRPVLDPQGLRNVDLDVADMFLAPHGLEQSVREPHREDVLHVLLAEEVVDAEDLILGEHACAASASSALAESRSVPNGFSRITFDSGLGQSDLAERVTIPPMATGGMDR